MLLKLDGDNVKDFKVDAWKLTWEKFVNKFHEYKYDACDKNGKLTYQGCVPHHSLDEEAMQEQVVMLYIHVFLYWVFYLEI